MTAAMVTDIYGRPAEPENIFGRALRRNAAAKRPLVTAANSKEQ